MRAIWIALGITAASTAAFAAAPSMSIGSLSMDLSQQACIAKGSTVMKAAGLTKNFEALTATVYGETGDYTGAIRCEAAKGIAVFIVAGPLGQETDKILGRLKGGFE